MIFLIASVLCNAGIYLLFKWYERLGVRIFRAIVINYITAFSLGLLLVPEPRAAFAAASSFPWWFIGGLMLGVCFIAVFYLMALTAQRSGVAVSTIASKMSLALAAALFVWVDPSEKMGVIKGIALLLAISGVVLSSLKSGPASVDRRTFIWPLLILLGSTVVDFGLAWLSREIPDGNQLTLFTSLPFLTAGVIGIVLILVQRLKGTRVLTVKGLVAGIALGLVNFGSIFFLLRAYDSGILTRSSLLTVNNLGVVIMGSLGAVLLFREKLSGRNLMGIGLGAAALGLLLAAG